MVVHKPIKRRTKISTILTINTYQVNINLKWIININVGVKTVILVEENIEEYFCDHAISKYTYLLINKTHTHKNQKNDKFSFIKIKIFWFWKMLLGKWIAKWLLREYICKMCIL